MLILIVHFHTFTLEDRSFLQKNVDADQKEKSNHKRYNYSKNVLKLTVHYTFLHLNIELWKAYIILKIRDVDPPNNNIHFYTICVKSPR